MALLLVIATTATGSVFAKHLGEQALGAELVLRAVVSEVRLQDALEWRAVSGQEVPPLRRELDASRARVEAHLRDSAALGLDAQVARDLAAQQERYHALVLRELDLLEAGSEEAAREFDEGHVDPEASALLAALARTDHALRDRSDALTGWSDFGVVFTVAVSLLLMATMQRRLHREQLSQEASQASEARYRALLEQSADIVIVCDPDGRVVYLTPAAERALGPTRPGGPGITVGDDLHDVVHPDDAAAMGVMLRSSAAGDLADLRLGRAHGACATYQTSVRDLTHDPSVGGVVFTCRDVSEARGLEASKNDFLATVSHELRTPLTSIRGYLELMEDGDFGSFDLEQRRALHVMHRNTDRLLGLVNQLLMLSELQTFSRLTSSRPVDLSAVVTGVAEVLAPAASSRSIHLELPDADPSVCIQGDAEKLERLVMNLVSNAVKFTPAGGRVEVDLSTAADHVLLQVRDDGMGIPREEQDQLFTRFFRSSYSKRHEIQGTGLGLALCRSIVQAHRGRIEIESEPGRGTCIAVALPRCVSDEQDAADETAVTGVPLLEPGTR